MSGLVRLHRGVSTSWSLYPNGSKLPKTLLRANTFRELHRNVPTADEPAILRWRGQAQLPPWVPASDAMRQRQEQNDPR